MPVESSAKTLTLSSMPLIDNGKIERGANHIIRECIRDIEDRPGEKTKRKAAIIVVFEPVLDDMGLLRSVDISFDFKKSIPNLKSSSYPMIPDGQKLIFQPDAPFDPRQNTFQFRPSTSEKIDPETGEVSPPGNTP